MLGVHLDEHPPMSLQLGKTNEAEDLQRAVILTKHQGSSLWIVFHMCDDGLYDLLGHVIELVEKLSLGMGDGDGGGVGLRRLSRLEVV